LHYSTVYESPAGSLLLASDGVNLTGLWIKGQKYFAATLDDGAIRKDDLEIFNRVRDWLDRYFAGGRPPISELPLAPRGTEFRRMVWNELIGIPYGGVDTYGDIARRIVARTGTKAMSARAIGGAVGHNPISIIIPCHRVVGSDGGLTGYAGGLGTKALLLNLERVPSAE
jgi:methylated-DNA-[protein]-cysteine S-methyltransferase